MKNEDHPRVCGEHGGGVYFPVDAGGSSPRMRGALRPSGFRHWFLGIIPAYAGSTIYKEIRAGRLADHPRVCGEHQEDDGEGD